MAKPRSTWVRAERAIPGFSCKLFGISLVVLITAIAMPAHAQLRPVDNSNSVFIDLGVLEGAGAPRGTVFPDVPTVSGSGLLLPPPASPQSRLLTPGAPAARATQPSPSVSLRPPAPAPRREAQRPAPQRAAQAPAQPKAPTSAPRQTVERTPLPQVALPEAPTQLAAPPPAVTTPPAPPQRQAAVTPPAKAAPKSELAPKAAPKSSGATPPPAIEAPKPPEATPPPPAAAPSPPAAPAPQQQAAIPERAPAPATKGAPAPESMEIRFAAGDANLPDDGKARLDKLVDAMRANEASRLQLLAYAGEDQISPSKARRLSLSRALSVRSYLIAKGIRSTRIDVRALGDQVPGGEPNRVDLKVTDR